MIRVLMARAQLCKQSFVCYFGDLRKAFDKVARSQVLQTFRDLIPAGPLQRALLDRHVGLGTSIAVDSEAISFCLPHGVAQGDALGPLAFVATYHRYCHQLDAVRNGFVHPGTHGLVCAPYGVEVPLHRTLFVDDHAEFWPIQHEHEAKRLLGDIEEVQEPWGLQTNHDKVQVLLQFKGKHARHEARRHIGSLRVRGQSLKVSGTAKYLVSVVAPSGTLGHEVSGRLRKAAATLAKVSKHTWRSGTPLRLRRDLYRSLVQSVLLYGLETGYMSKSQLSRLESLQNRALRRMLRIPVHITRVPNVEMRQRAGLHSVESLLRYKRLCWLREVLRNPHLHQQALCALFGTLPWHPARLFWHSIPFLAQLKDDLCALPDGVELTMEDPPTWDALEQIGQVPDHALRKVLSFESSADRSPTRPDQGPATACCPYCPARYPTHQRLALHLYSRHGIRNARRALVTSTTCPACGEQFATMETARRHVVRNVCRRVSEVCPGPPTQHEATSRQRKVLQPVGPARGQSTLDRFFGLRRQQ